MIEFLLPVVMFVLVVLVIVLVLVLVLVLVVLVLVPAVVTFLAPIVEQWEAQLAQMV